MAGGFHSTSPFHHSVALVARVTSKFPSALQQENDIDQWDSRLANTMHFQGCHSLVVEHNVRSPDVVGRNVKLLDTAVLLGVPDQLVVVPELQEKNPT